MKAASKLLVGLSLVVSMTLFDGPAQAAAPVNTDGDFAHAYFGSQPGGPWGSVWVNTVDNRMSGASLGSFALVSYDVHTSGLDTYAFCRVSRSAVVVGPTSLTMDLDLSTVPIWTPPNDGSYQPPTGSYCTGPSASTTGSLHASWERTHQWRSSYSGRNEYTFPAGGGTTVTFRFVGSTQTTSAAASGTLLDIAFSSTGEIGRSHDLQFTIVR